MLASMYEIHNAAIQAQVKHFGDEIKKQMPDGWGFVLMMFDYNSDSLFYISSADRGGSIDIVKEWIQKMETSHYPNLNHGTTP